MDNKKTKKILDEVFKGDVANTNLKDIRGYIDDFITTMQINGSLDGANVFVNITDSTKKKWKEKDHFTKIFDSEIDYAVREYTLTRSEIAFLKSLSPYLMWELNLLVNQKTNEPLSQHMLSEKLGLNRATIRRNMEALESKLCIYTIQHLKEKFYIVNPYLMYAGGNINTILPSIFDSIGYISSKERDRIYRRKNTKKG